MSASNMGQFADARGARWAWSVVPSKAPSGDPIVILSLQGQGHGAITIELPAPASYKPAQDIQYAIVMAADRARGVDAKGRPLAGAKR